MKKLLFLVSILLFPFMVNASLMHQDIEILENGDLHVKEAIAIDGSYNGFKLELKYKYYDENSIYSADDLEIIKVCEADKNNPIENVGECFNEVTYANKGDSLKYTYQKGNIDTFMLYNPSWRNKAFYVEYILKNVIVKHNDIAELRLNMLSSSFVENLDKVEIKVKLPKKSETLRAWAHGPLWGNISLDENKEYAIFTIDDYYQYTAVDIRMAFDNSLVNTNKKTNKDALNSIVEEETRLANEANEERERQKKELEEYQKRMARIQMLSNLAIVGWMVGAVIIFIVVYKKYDKEYKSTFTGKYFRDFPSNHSPETIEYLMTGNITSNGLSSSILNIIYKKGFKIEEYMAKEGIFKNKDVKKYTLILNDNGLKEELTDEEKWLRAWLVSEYGDGAKFDLDSLKTTSRSESSARKFIEKYNKWINKCTEIAKKENFYENNGTKKLLPALYAVIGIMLSFSVISITKLSYISLIMSFVFLIYIIAFKKRTANGNELYTKWHALRNFLNDFGTFSEKELPEITLWEKYLVYANIFGLADKLRKQMEVKVPNLNDDISGMNMRDYWVINNAINRSIATSVSAAVTEAKSKIASSNSSSGGGFGGGFSGGGGGGGFSGGGGSGGGRF